MEFKFDLGTFLEIDEEGFCIIESDICNKLKPRELKMLNDIINTIGALSSQAQGIRVPITTSSKFYTSEGQKIYFKVVDNVVIGLLKTGVKNLFINDRYGTFHQIAPMCLLDFYVHESQQRNGYGKQLFEKNVRS
jgi:alpha-tubulin N-acetyltransferase 1